MKPFAESCQQNRDPILNILKTELADRQQLLELSSGTGQHAVYFAEQLPHIIWQTSDLKINHAGIQAWLEEAALTNTLPPLELDVLNPSHWPTTTYDAVFSANAVHIMGWGAVEAMFTALGKVMSPAAKLVLYGPFNYDGQFTSESNARFDQWLKQRDPASGIRDFEALNTLAEQQDMSLQQDYEMPQNNRILVWQRQN